MSGFHILPHIFQDWCSQSEALPALAHPRRISLCLLITIDVRVCRSRTGLSVSVSAGSFEKLYSPGVKSLLKLLQGGSLQPNLIKQWDRKLRMIEALLSDAEQKQSHNKAVKLWLQDLQDLAYDLEDILDEFATEAQLYKLNKLQQNDSKPDHTNFFGFADDMVQGIFASGSRAAESLTTLFNTNNPDMQSKIGDINDRLQDILSQITSLGLLAVPSMQHQIHQTAPSISWRETTCLVSEPVVYGRDDQKKNIISRLLRDEPFYDNYIVVPIVGQGGIGKTTLAQYVYNDKQVEDYFNLKAWVCVSDLFDVKKITATIINSGTDGIAEFDDLNQAQVKLNQVLTGRRFLIVLDDVWSDNYDDWYQLQTPFRQAAKGSRVIVTTRIEKIARIMIRNPTHSTIISLGGLSGDDCWRLFLQHTNEDSDLSEMRKDIILKCKGLPLAAKALGGLLKSTVEKSQRQKILNSSIWSEQSSVLPVLKLSYQHLPSHLKRIFGYCSIIPKGRYFREKDLVLMWMAEGFLPESIHTRMEDIGHDYFHDLVSRSLFEPSTNQYFRMHDLIHDLAQWAAGSICCTVGTTAMRRFCSRTRHLSLEGKILYGTDGRLRRQPVALEDGGKLRTFAYYSYGILYSMYIGNRPLPPHPIDGIEYLDLIPIFRNIRTLSLAFMECRVLLSCIGDLKLLRLLDLSSTSIEELPESISNLCNLQTLLLENCFRLKKLPTKTRFLIHLRHLNIGGTALQTMPLGIGKLTNLQELDEFIIGAGHGTTIKELKNLKKLHGKLTVYGLENIASDEDAKEAKIHEKEDLDELHLKWGTCIDADENTTANVLEQLRPHSSIKACKLDGYKGLALPAWLGDTSFTKMVCISLVDCENCKSLLSLGKLLSLKELYVEGMHAIKQLGPDFYGYRGCSNLFPSLRILRFERMYSWVKWLHPSADNRAFPCLEELSIKQCPLLQGYLPLHLPSLQKLEINRCSQLSASLPNLPSLENLMIEECKSLSSPTQVIFCSKMMTLRNIPELTIFPRHCPYLEKLIISNCYSCVTFDQIPLTLRRLRIENCQELQYIKFEESSPCFSFVEEVSISNCGRLRTICKIPSTLPLLKIRDCQKIKSVEIEVSSSLSGIGEKLDNNFRNHQKIITVDSFISPWWIDNCQELHSVVFKESSSPFFSFNELSISNCQSLVTIDGISAALRWLKIINCEKLQCVEFEESYSSCFEGLSISDCQSLVTVEHIPLTLQQLKINNCEKLQCIEFEESSCSSNEGGIFLQEVAINGCRSLSSLFSKRAYWLKVLDKQLGLFPKAPNELVYLTQLTLSRCGSLVSLPSLLLPQIKKLKLSDCENLKALPDQMHKMNSLEYLSLTRCPKLNCFPEGGLPRNLSQLRVHMVNIEQPIQEWKLHNSSLQVLHLVYTDIQQPIQEWGLHLFTSLDDLGLCYIGSLSDSIECIPGAEFSLPSSLCRLKLWGFEKLKSIFCSSLPGLIKLDVGYCQNLESLGDNGLPPKLRDIQVFQCPLMEQQLQRDRHGRPLLHGV